MNGSRPTLALACRFCRSESGAPGPMEDEARRNALHVHQEPHLVCFNPKADEPVGGSGYGPSSSSDRKVLGGNCFPIAARTAPSSTFKPRPGPSGSAMYPSTGRRTFGHKRWPSCSNGRKYSVMMKFGMQAEAWTVADRAMVVEL